MATGWEEYALATEIVKAIYPQITQILCNLWMVCADSRL
jgi:hypothetical protein